jgi:hypothetical protein
LTQKSFYCACFAAHFLLVAVISTRELCSVLSQSRTIFPAALNSRWQQAEKIGSTILLQNSTVPKALRETTTAYFHLAGIESGYGFFAPNVSGPSKLVFELHYPDGRSESEVPAVSSDAAGLRVATLLDKITRPQFDPLREDMVEMLTVAVWREHRDATMIRAVLGVVTLPSAEDFEKGIGESNEFLYAYDFGFDQPAAKDAKP